MYSNKLNEVVTWVCAQVACEGKPNPSWYIVGDTLTVYVFSGRKMSFPVHVVVPGRSCDCGYGGHGGVYTLPEEAGDEELIAGLVTGWMTRMGVPSRFLPPPSPPSPATGETCPYCGAEGVSVGPFGCEHPGCPH